MSRFLKFLIFFLVLISLSFFGGVVLRINSYKEHYATEISKIIGGNVEINGTISIIFSNVGLRATSVNIIHYSSGSKYSVGKLDLHFSKGSILFGKAEISKITMRDGEIVLNNINELSSTRIRALYLDNIVVKIPDYSIETRVEKALYRSSDVRTELRGNFGQTEDNLYSFLLSFDKQKRYYGIEITSQENKIRFLSSEKTLKISGEGKDLIGILSAFTKIQWKPNTDASFSITDKYDVDNKEYNLGIQSSFFDSQVRISLKDNERRKVDVKFRNLNLEKVELASLQEIFSFLLSLQKLHSKETDFLLDIEKCKLQDAVIENIHLNLSDYQESLSINEFSARIAESIIDGKGQVDKRDTRYPIFTSELTWEGTLSKEIAKLLNLEKYETIERWLSQEFRVNLKIIAGPEMLLLQDVEVAIGTMKLRGDLKYNNFLRKLGSNVGIDSLVLDGIQIRDGFLSFLDKIDDLNTSIRINLTNTNFNKEKISHIDFTHHSMNRHHVSNIDVDSKDLSFTGKLKFDKIPGILEIDVNGDMLNSSLIKFPKLFTLVDTKKGTEIQWNDDNLPEIPSNLSCKLNVTFNKVFSKNPSDSMALQLVSEVHNDVLNISEFSLKKEDFLLELVSNFTFNRNPNSVVASINLSGLDLKKFLKENFDINYIAGIANIQASLSSRGNTVKQIVSNAEGKLALNSPKIDISGGNIDILSSAIPKVKLLNDLDDITRIKFFTGGTTLLSVNGLSNISDGIIGTSLTFSTKTTSGILSSNFQVSTMQTSSVARVFFPIDGEAIPVDITIEDSIWKPKIFFDNQAIFNTIRERKPN